MTILFMRMAIVLLLVSLTPALASSQQRLSAQMQSAVDSIAEQSLRRGPIAGMSIAIARGSDLPMAKGYGYADLKNDFATPVDTVYHLDSITKNFTAAAVLQLADQGSLIWMTTSSSTWPSFPLSGIVFSF